MLTTSPAEFSHGEIREMKKRCERAFLEDHPDLVDGLAEMRRVYDRAERNAQTAIHVITGPARSCKSTILTRFVYEACERLNEALSENERGRPYTVETNQKGVVRGVLRADGPDGDERPIVYVSVPSIRSLKSFAKALLTALKPRSKKPNDDREKPMPKSLNKDDLLFLVLPHLLGQRVQILLLDEFHNAVTSKNPEVIWDLSETIKDIMNETRIQVAVAGLPDAVLPIDQNDQLDGRCRLRWSTRPFEWGATIQKQAEFLEFLDKLERAMALPKPSHLSEPDRAKRIHSYTGGIIGRVTLLLQEAAFEALDCGEYFISDAMIEWAHDRIKKTQMNESGKPIVMGRPTKLRGRGNKVPKDYKKRGQ
jgi:hypothetical protein